MKLKPPSYKIARAVRFLIILTLILLSIYCLSKSIDILNIEKYSATRDHKISSLTTDTSSANNPTIVTEKAIKSWSLFGKIENSETNANNENISNSHFENFKVLGILFDSSDRKSSAIVTSSSQDNQVVSSNQKIGNNVSVSSIEPNRIVLLIHGKRKIFPISEYKFSTERKPQPREAAEQNRYKSTASSNENPEGYTIKKLSAKMKSFGLKKEDRILSVNGFPLGTESENRTAMNFFYKSNQKTIEIERSGKVMIIEP